MVYVADTNNNAIRQVTPAGVVTTLAGPPAAPSSFGIVGLQDGVGTSARFNAPQGIAVDRLFNLYVADTNNHAIRMVTPGGVVSTIAGRGFAGNSEGRFNTLFNSPTGIAVDPALVLRGRHDTTRSAWTRRQPFGR
jgi:DNA-binding beta-propeller fold protein YncE